MNELIEDFKKYEKRKAKYITFSLDCNIRSKKTCKQAERTRIQLEIIKKMKMFQHKTIKSDIVVEIVSYTGDKRSPGIDKWAKNIIDIMHKTEYLSNPSDAQFLPFVDDKQIRYLYVSYRYIEEKSETFIKIVPFNSFLKDLDLDNSISNNNLDNTEELYESNYSYDSCLSKEANEALRKMYLQNKQEVFGNLISINKDIIRNCFIYSNSKNISVLKNLNNSIKTMMNNIVKSPIKLSIPSLPTNTTNDTSKITNYKKVIEESLTEYLNKHTLLKELQCPLIISIIYVPGRNSKVEEKDIDNILLDYIVPVVNQEMHPPVTIGNIQEYEDFDGIKKKPILVNDKSGQIVGYEILKLKKNFSKTGYLTIGFKQSIITESIISNCYEKLNDYCKYEL